MHYTHYGIGHPTVLCELTKACGDVDPADDPGWEENENDQEEWENNIQPRFSVDGDEGGQEDDGDGEDEEQECDEEEDDKEEEIGEDVDDEADKDEDEDDMLSF